jgi:DNA invertase Pin-like site-specific DNA recombinase
VGEIRGDKDRGRDTQRPQLQAALDHMRDGDALVVHSMDRLARNMRDLQNLVAELNEKNIAVEFVKENLAFSAVP